MMRRSRKISILLALVLLIGLGATSAMAEGDTVNVVLWTFADSHARYFEYIAEAYNNANPNVTITVELMNNTSLQDRLAVVIAAGGEGAPDLVDIEQGQFPRYMNEDKMCFVPIDGLLEQDGLSDAMVEARLSLYAYEGQYYGLEHALCPVLMVYRPDLFEAYDIAVPTTWDEYVAAAEAFAEQGIYITAQNDFRNGQTNFFHLGLVSSDCDIIAEDGSFRLTDEWADWLERYTALQNDGYIYVSENDADKYYAISEDMIATDFVADWAAGWLRDNVPEQSGQWRMTYLPLITENASRTSVNGGTGLCMLKYSAVDQAILWDIMKFAMLDADNCVVKYEMISLYPPVYDAMEACNTPVEYYGDQNLGELWQELAPETPVQRQAAFRTLYLELMTANLYDYVEGNLTTDEFIELLHSEMEARSGT